jgi:hypothetical protein
MRALQNGAHLMTRGALSGIDEASRYLAKMAFIICDDHNQSVEADGMDPKTAKQHMLGESKPSPSALEKEVLEFGKVHRDCNIRILAD